MCKEKSDNHNLTIEQGETNESNVVQQEIPTISAKEIGLDMVNPAYEQASSSNIGKNGQDNDTQSPPKPKRKVNVRFKKTRDVNIPSLDASSIPNGLSEESRAIDAAVQQNTIESDQDYREITKDIIEKTSKQLNAHTNAKKPLRLILLWFVIILLSAQFIALVFILFFNNLWGLGISDFIINVYVVSLFLETLAGLMIMIKFAFDSKQEVQLIKVLNAIIRHFKKFDDK